MNVKDDEIRDGDRPPYGTTSPGFFNVPRIIIEEQVLRDGTYGLSSLSEKTRNSTEPFTGVIRKAALSPQLFEDPECWSGRGLPHGREI